MNIELEEIRVQRNAIKKSLEALEQRELEINAHERDADYINADYRLTMKDINPDHVNYIMGQSTGYVSGFTSAINSVVCAIANKYRDIPMTESELYMIVELGEMKERAWMKDYKQRKILEKNGWKQDSKNAFAVPVWKKEQPEDEVSE